MSISKFRSDQLAAPAHRQRLSWGARKMNCLMYALTLTLTAIGVAQAQSGSSSSVPVTVDNFVRAETDSYFARFVNQGGFGKFSRVASSLSFFRGLSLTLANSEQAYRPRGMRNIGSLSTIS